MSRTHAAAPDQPPRPQGPGLRSRLIRTLVVTVSLTVVLGFIGIETAMTMQTLYIVKQMPPDLLATQALINQGIPPEAEALKRLVQAGQEIETSTDIGLFVSLALLLILSGLSGVGIGHHLARRIAEPMDRVAGAARRLAEGEFTARAPVPVGAAKEAVQLIQDFNHMAAALETLDRELNASAAATAHELRTPLTILRGRLQGIRDGIFQPSTRELDGLIGQVEGLARIVEDLRTVSLANTGRLELRKGPVDLATEMDMLVDTIRPDLEAAGLEVQLDLRPARLHADAPRLRQAALALLDNARRHAAGEVRVETRWQTGTDGQPVAVLRVLDRGPGLRADPPARVFDRFWRGDPSRSRDSGGSGLGLAVVKAIIEAHGGTVLAADRPGGGAVLELRLPC